jgi:hypothetical protein
MAGSGSCAFLVAAAMEVAVSMALFGSEKV